MKRFIILTSVLAAVGAFGAMPAQAAISADINIRVGRRPPPVYYTREPRAYMIPRTDIRYYAAPDYDMYCDGSEWYLNDGGYWYRGPSYRGPFVQITFESIPYRVNNAWGQHHRYPSRPYGWNSQGSRGYDDRSWNQGRQGSGYGQPNGYRRDNSGYRNNGGYRANTPNRGNGSYQGNGTGSWNGNRRDNSGYQDNGNGRRNRRQDNGNGRSNQGNRQRRGNGGGNQNQDNGRGNNGGNQDNGRGNNGD